MFAHDKNGTIVTKEMIEELLSWQRREGERKEREEEQEKGRIRTLGRPGGVKTERTASDTFDEGIAQRCGCGARRRDHRDDPRAADALRVVELFERGIEGEGVRLRRVRYC